MGADGHLSPGLNARPPTETVGKPVGGEPTRGQQPRGRVLNVPLPFSQGWRETCRSAGSRVTGPGGRRKPEASAAASSPARQELQEKRHHEAPLAAIPLLFPPESACVPHPGCPETNTGSRSDNAPVPAQPPRQSCRHKVPIAETSVLGGSAARHAEGPWVCLRESERVRERGRERQREKETDRERETERAHRCARCEGWRATRVRPQRGSPWLLRCQELTQEEDRRCPHRLKPLCSGGVRSHSGCTPRLQALGDLTSLSCGRADDKNIKTKEPNMRQIQFPENRAKWAGSTVQGERL